MIARIATIAFGFILAASARAAVLDDDGCGDDHPGQPRCSLPPLPEERMAILTCHTLPAADAGQMIRLSRGYAILDVQAEVYTVNRDNSVVTLDASYAVAVNDQSTLDVFDTEYTAAGFYFHELLRLDDIDQPNHVETYHVRTGALDADLDCSPYGR